MSKPRIPPLTEEQFTDDHRTLAGEHLQYNFARVMVQHPDLYRVYIPFAGKLMRETVLTLRERELAILRTLELCDEHYDAPHHRVIAGHVGLSDAEINAAIAGGGECLCDRENQLVAAAGQLVTEKQIAEDTWQALAQSYSRPQLMELVFLVGNYTMMAMATNSFGIPLEGGEH